MPGKLGAGHLALQAAADASLVGQAAAPMLIAGLTGFTLLISPAGALAPAHAGTYGPLRTLRAGAAAFLVKSTPPEDLIGLVRVAAEGHTVLSPAAARRLIAASADSQPAAERARQLAARSPSARWRCSPAWARGSPMPRSRPVSTSPKRRSRATFPGCSLAKLGLDNRTQAGLLAHDAGLTSR